MFGVSVLDRSRVARLGRTMMVAVDSPTTTHAVMAAATTAAARGWQPVALARAHAPQAPSSPGA